MIIIENINYISFSVSDLDKSIDFYRDNFGFDVIERQSGSKEVMIQVGDITLRLCKTDDVRPSEKSENYICFSLDMDDFDDAVDLIEEENIKVLHGPETVKNGKKIVVSDPDGNKIELFAEKTRGRAGND